MPCNTFMPRCYTCLQPSVCTACTTTDPDPYFLTYPPSTQFLLQRFMCYLSVSKTKLHYLYSNTWCWSDMQQLWRQVLPWKLQLSSMSCQLCSVYQSDSLYKLYQLNLHSQQQSMSCLQSTHSQLSSMYQFNNMHSLY